MVQPAELSPGAESKPEPRSVAARQEKLLEKLNLDGLAHWSPENVVAARELVLAYHDVFTLESNELGCTSAIEHKIRNENDKPFKEQFQRIPLPLLEEVHASLRDMLEAGAIHPSQSPWCNAVILVRRKDGTLHFCVDFRRLNMHTKDSYPCCRFRRPQKAWQGRCISCQWTSNQAFGRSRWPQDPNSTRPLLWVTTGSEFTCMPFGLCNAPMTFQHLMQNTLWELNLTYCVIYLDDIIVFGHMEEEHLEHLRMVFESSI